MLFMFLPACLSSCIWGEKSILDSWRSDMMHASWSSQRRSDCIRIVLWPRQDVRLQSTAMVFYVEYSTRADIGITSTDPAPAVWRGLQTLADRCFFYKVYTDWHWKMLEEVSADNISSMRNCCVWIAVLPWDSYPSPGSKPTWLKVSWFGFINTMYGDQCVRCMEAGCIVWDFLWGMICSPSESNGNLLMCNA